MRDFFWTKDSHEVQSSNFLPLATVNISILPMDLNWSRYVVTRNFNFPKLIKSISSFHTAWEVSVFGFFPIRIQSKCGKIQTRKTANTDTFYAVSVFVNTELCQWKSRYLTLYRHHPRCWYLKEQPASNNKL